MKSKLLFCLIMAFFMGLMAQGQVPQTIDFQGRMADSNGDPINGPHTITFSLFSSETGGEALWAETRDVTFANGLFHVALGEENPIPASVLIGGNPWLQIAIGAEVLSPRTRLNSAPFSRVAQNVVGGSADVTHVSVGGQQVIDQQGQWVGQAVSNIIETDPSVPQGTQIGEMQYWNGSAWVTVPSGSSGQVLTFVNGVPTWTGTAAGETDVVNATTGKIWMDRNLGATQVATSSTDADAYGHLYQWGRGTDGHQVRTSGTIATLSSSDTPGHGDFITPSSSPWDWLDPQNDNLWQGVSGVNNPCPAGYRLPTEVEWNAERLSWSTNNSAGAYASPLKLPVGGYRYSLNGSLFTVGSLGHYWSSTVDGINARYLYFDSSNAYTITNYNRASGLSVRCLKD